MCITNPAGKNKENPDASTTMLWPPSDEPGSSIAFKVRIFSNQRSSSMLDLECIFNYVGDSTTDSRPMKPRMMTNKGFLLNICSDNTSLVQNNAQTSRTV